MNNWEEFIKLRTKTDFKGMETNAMTLRIPKELKKVIIEDLRTLEDRDEKMSFNEFILLQLMNACNVSVSNNQSTQEFKRTKNKGLESFLKDLEENKTNKKRKQN